MNWGTSRMKSSKALKTRDSRLCQVIARDKGAKRPLGEEECSLGRGTIGMPYY